jgi:ATP-dependent Clp protease ATP-binding subunit ClpA
MMDIDKKNWTSKALQSWLDVTKLAETKGHKITNIYHLFVCLWNNHNETFLHFLNKKGISLSIEEADNILSKFVKKHPHLFFDSDSSKQIEDELKKCVLHAAVLATKHDNLYLSTEHFIWGVLSTSDTFCEELLANGIDTEYLKQSINAFLSKDFLPIGEPLFDEDGDINSQEDIEELESLAESQLERFCILLNDVVKQPNFGIVSGRDKEIKELEEILSCKVKSNCILVGEAGCGKTAIAEGLAQTIQSPDYSGSLKNAKIYSLDVGSLIAGSKYRGQFESRFEKLIAELKEDKNAVLFIDEIHTIIGAGGKEGSPDLANLLKPALARGEIKCIGATTSTEYKKYVEKDPALSRRFHALNVLEPDLEKMKEIAIKATPAYEKHHKIKFPKKLLEMSIDMCDTYLPNKKFIDKAFDVIDRSFAKAKIKGSKKVELDDLLSVVSEFSGIAIETLRNNINKKFSDILPNLESQVFGQKNALKSIYDCLACAKAGLNAPNRPLASFVFVGPTSVGKTYTAKKIAKEFFGNDESYLQLNMSEYQDQISISRLIGASAGYVGFDDGGLLTDFVRKNPNSLILFDEIEKSNYSILNILLQILDEGKVKDSLGRDVDFSRTIIVLTTNVGASQSQKQSMGFMPSSESKQETFSSAVKNYLSPEMMARIDEVVVFNAIGEDSICKLFDQYVAELVARAKTKGIELFCDIKIQDIDKNFSNLHARQVKQLFRNKIQTPIAHFISSRKSVKKISVKVLENAVIIN